MISRISMSKTEKDTFKHGPCLLCGGTTQPFADLIGHIREMHSTAHVTSATHVVCSLYPLIMYESISFSLKDSISRIVNHLLCQFTL
jgi:hypothetical protein